VRFPAVLLALVLINPPWRAIAQSGDLIEQTVSLASGEKVSHWGLVSYNKLRRGTEMELTYQMFIRPAACFLLADDASADRRALKLEITASPGLVATAIRVSARGRHATVNGVKVANCSDEVQFRARIVAPPDQPLGMHRLTGEINWQAINATGTLPPQTTKFEFPVEVVEHGDRTAKYNESYGYRPKPDLVWRIPTLPFVLIYCAARGGGDCPD
jgi:hypothetical protein